MKFLAFLLVLCVFSGCAPLMNSDLAVIYPGDTYTFEKQGLYVTEGRLYDLCAVIWHYMQESEPDIEFINEWQTSH